MPADSLGSDDGEEDMVAGTNSTVFINEIHYDNDGGDTGEFIEIANTEEQDLTGWTLLLYNGSNGTVYDTIALSGSALLTSIAISGIQNGAPDGMALVDADGNVVQFLSYEGSFTATEGAANGMTSTDIGVAETGTTPIGQSLQLTGSGSTYGDFTWAAAAIATSGTANNSQTLSAPVVEVLNETFETDGGGTRYTFSSGEGNDGASDFFTRTDGSDVSSTFAVTGQGGDFFFAAQDIDSVPGLTTDGEQSLFFTGLDVSGLSNLLFSIDLAEDDSSDGNEDWDSDDYLQVYATIDGGTPFLIFAVENDGIGTGTGFNGAPLIDTNLDGNGDGAEITSAFQTFTAAIAGSGSTLDLEIRFRLASGDEDIAIDNILVTTGGGTPPTPQPGEFSVDDVTLAEGDSGTTDFTFTVTRANGSDGAVSVDYAITGSGANAADAADFGGSLPSGTVSFADGETSKTVTVAVSGDTAVESDETFDVTISTATPGATIGDAIGLGTITNDDGPGVIRIADTSANETDASLQFTLTRTGGSSGVVSVQVALDPGNTTATPGSDTSATLSSPFTITFADGQTTQTFGLTLADDTDFEGDETIGLVLQNPTGGATISATEGSAIGTIIDDDILPQGPAEVFINEIHYDNAGGDIGEGVEIAGPAGTDLTGWSLVFYNGNGGVQYDTLSLSGTIPDQDDGYGTIGFARSGIQNGSPDAVALVDASGNVVQFLSYEGSLTATDGPAIGLTSEDIGVAEDGGTPQGFSLQLSGTGFFYDNFVWESPRDDNFGAVNTGQDFVAANPNGTLVIEDASITESDSGTIAITFNVFRVGGTTGAVTADYAVQFGGAFSDAEASDFSGATSGTVTFADGESFAAITLEINGDTTPEPNEFFDLVLSNVTGGATLSTTTATGTITNDDPLNLAIYDIQSAGHSSPYVGNTVTTTGIVTAVASNGFYLQDAVGDGIASTSDAIFVFTSSAPGVIAGDGITVTGTVSEFLAGSDPANLTTTQIVSSSISVESVGNALPAAVIIGPNGITPPTETIEDDGFATFDPANDGIDFWESLEGMLVTIENPVAVDSTNGFGELWTVASDGAGNLEASNVSADGFVVIDGGAGGLGEFDAGAGSDFNPERIQIDSAGELNGIDQIIPDVDPGTLLDDVTGVVAYAFENFQIQPTSAVTVNTASSGTAETTALTGADNQLTVATYNVLNLDINAADGDDDVADGQFAAVAFDIASNLNNPDIVVLQEIQDDSGSANDGTVSADMTLEALSDAIFAESGVRYSWFDNPFVVDGETGGQPGGNIRVAFLYRDDRVDFDPLSAFTITDPSDGSLDVAFQGSRAPLAGEFTFNGETVTVIGNHFSSKIGSDSSFSANQPPANASALSRAAQAAAVNAYIDGLLLADADANIIAAGDFNEFQFEEPMEVLTGELDFDGGSVSAGSDVVLTNLTDFLDPAERYSVLFQGNAQQLDHILVTEELADGAVIDVVHTNVFAGPGTRGSDHDPVLARFNLGTQTINGDKFSNTLDGNDGDDIIFGGASSDTINGNGGDDELRGGPGLDTLNGGTGDDILRGGGQADILNGDEDADMLFGNKGEDTLNGGIGNDVLRGGNQDDMLFGDDGDDKLFGENQNDQLFGGIGNDMLDGGNAFDWLDGGEGMDMLTGGKGQDTFVLHADGTVLDADTITDFGQIGSGRDTILIEGAEGREITVVQNGADTQILSDGVLVATVLNAAAPFVESNITYPAPTAVSSAAESASPYADMAIAPINLFDPLGSDIFA